MTTLSDLVLGLFTALEDAAVAYCVLRNYESLPILNVGSDIDILIEEVNVLKVVQFINALEHVRITSINRRAYVSTIFMDGVQSVDGRDSLQIDLVTSLSWKGCPYLSVGRVLDTTITHPTHALIRIPVAYHEALISFFSSYLMGGWINDRYQKSVQSSFKENEWQVVNTLAVWAGSNLSWRIVRGVQEDHRPNLLKMLPEVKRQLIRYYVPRHPVALSIQLLRHYLFELSIRYTSKPLTEICVLGVDGSGKSTIINKLLERIGSRIKEREVIHLKPKLRPVQGQSGTPCSTPHAFPPRAKLVSILKLLSWVVLYRWRRYMHGHKNSTLIIWDRYIFDILVDPLRYRVDLPEWLLEAIVRLAPVPDCLIILDISPEVAFRRKQEVALADLRRICRGYVDLASYMPNARVVSTEGDIEQTVDQVLEFVSVILARAAANRVDKWISSA